MSTEKNKSRDGLLTTILRVMANSYPSDLIHKGIEVHGEAVEGWTDIGDTLAYSAAFEVAESYNDKYQPVQNLGNAIQVIAGHISDLEGIKAGLLRHTIEKVLYDFLVWVKEAGRVTISRALLLAWIEIHPCETARGLQSEVVKMFEGLHPALKENRQFTVGDEFNVDVAIKGMAMHMTKLTGGGHAIASAITTPAAATETPSAPAVPLGLKEG